MKHYKKLDGTTWAFETNGSQDHLITADMVSCGPPVDSHPTPEYSALRALAYPPFADYLDGVIKGDDAQIQTYKDACLAVKAKYPKTKGGK